MQKNISKRKDSHEKPLGRKLQYQLLLLAGDYTFCLRDFSTAFQQFTMQKREINW